MPRLAKHCCVPAGELRDLPVTVDLKAKHLASDPWQSYLPSFSSGCGAPPSVLRGFLCHTAHGCQGVVGNNGWTHHLFPITLWQSTGWCPRCCSVNYYSRYRRAGGKKELELNFKCGWAESLHHTEPWSWAWKPFFFHDWISLLPLVSLSD